MHYFVHLFFSLFSRNALLALTLHVYLCNHLLPSRFQIATDEIVHCMGLFSSHICIWQKGLDFIVQVKWALKKTMSNLSFFSPLLLLVLLEEIFLGMCLSKIIWSLHGQGYVRNWIKLALYNPNKVGGWWRPPPLPVFGPPFLAGWRQRSLLWCFLISSLFRWFWDVIFEISWHAFEKFDIKDARSSSNQTQKWKNLIFFKFFETNLVFWICSWILHKKCALLSCIMLV